VDRKTLITKHANLTKEIGQLRQELAAYSEQDPVEVEKKSNETQQFRSEVEKYTDQILSMEGWLKGQMGGDLEQMTNLKREHYGDEYDAEEGSLREL
jgi:uncharacterized protein YPO0396